MPEPKTITIKTDSEAAELFASLLIQAKQTNPELTNGTFFRQVVSAYGQPQTGSENNQDELISELREKLKQRDEELANCDEFSKRDLNFVIQLRSALGLEDDASYETILTNCATYAEFAAENNRFIGDLYTILNMTSGEMSHARIIEEIKATQQRAMMALQDEEPKTLAANQFLLTFDEPHLSLLLATENRLSERYKKEVTAEMILKDMFARYTIDQLNQWFYPFVIKGDEDFKSVTGYTQKQLQEWLRKRTA